MVSLSGMTGFGRRVVSDFSDKNVTFIAAALAYHAFISLAPLLLLLFLLLATVGSGLETRIAEVAAAWLPGPMADVVTQLLEQNPDRTGVSIIGVVVLLWGTLKIFRGLDTAFSEIYETVDTNSLTDKFRDGVVVLTALVVALVAMVASSVVLGGVVDRLPFSAWLTPLALVAGLVVAFYPIYYVFPDADVGVWDVLPGVVVAALGWAALQGLFQLYVELADPSSGSIFGGVVVIVTYLYFSALVLLLGAVINAVSGGHSSGESSGVGEVLAGNKSERHDELSVAEAAAYLRDLRSELIADSGTYRRTDVIDDRPAPSDGVELYERSTVDDEHNEWTVTLRWEFTDEELAHLREKTAASDSPPDVEFPEAAGS